MNEIDLHGVIDMHVHAAPDVTPRLADDIEIASAAANAGMQALVFKSHVTHTADRAAIAERVVKGIRVFGGLALNYPIGGFNPAAVEVAIKLGARKSGCRLKIRRTSGSSTVRQPGLSIFDGNGQIREAVA